MTEEIITQPDELAAGCEYLAGCPVFGFDTEFVGEDTYHPHLCLIQIATPDRLLLIDPLTVGPLDAFWRLVVDPAHQVVVHAAREEVRLCRYWSGQAPGNLFDLQIAAGLVGLAYPMGHGSLVQQLLGVHLGKGETLTEWRSRPLTRQQVRYAFDDVRHLLPLWEKLSSRLSKLGRTEWAREEFARLAVAAAPEEPTTERWRKLRGLGSLDRRRLAIVRDLFHWREQTAARTNRPTRAIVRDDLLIEIARRNPRGDRDLQVMRGLPKRDHAAILEVVERSRNLPLEECPTVIDRDQDPQQVTWVTNVLNAVLGDYCARQRLAANLVGGSSEVRLLVRARMMNQPLPAAALLTQGWRGASILPELLAVLDGQRSLRVADLAADAPFAFAPSVSPPQAQ